MDSPAKADASKGREADKSGGGYGESPFLRIVSRSETWQIYSCFNNRGEFTLYFFFWILLLLPLVLLVVACSKAKAQYAPLTLLTLSAILLVASGVRSLKLVLLGADYSPRLYTTLEINLFLAVIVGIYLALKQRWIATSAAAFLVLAWFYLMAANSVV